MKQRDEMSPNITPFLREIKQTKFLQIAMSPLFIQLLSNHYGAMGRNFTFYTFFLLFIIGIPHNSFITLKRQSNIAD